MPIWLQLTAAVVSGLAAWLMGLALVPFLQRLRFCEPEQRGADEEQIQEQLRPTMAGLLCVFGSIFGLVLSYTLYLQFTGADRTSLGFQSESRGMYLAFGYALLMGLAGFVTDVLCVKHRLHYRISPLLRMGGCFLAALAFLLLLHPSTVLELNSMRIDFGAAAVPLLAAVLAVCWGSMQGLERDNDGITLTVSATELLFLTVLLLRRHQEITALPALTTAGACIGCMVWNLHPAKCRLGNIGSFWLGALLPVLCLLHGEVRSFLVLMAVCAVDLLPLLFRRRTLLKLAQEAEIKPLSRIAVFAGFAAFCGVIAVLIEA